MNKKFSVLTLGFLLFVILILIFFHTRGFIPYDEGWFLQAGLRLNDGEKIYKDFEFLYNPGGAYFTAIAFTLFGKSVLASRIIVLANSILTVSILFFIGKYLKFSGILTSLLILTYVFWGPGHINFVWPVMFCLTTAIASGALFMLVQKSKNKTRLLFLIGCISGLTFIFKQNFGMAIFLANLLAFILIKDLRSIKLFFWYLSGHAIIIALQVIYLIHQGTLIIYIREIYYFTVVKIYQQGILNSDLPWQYPASIYSKFFKLIIYTSPLTISLFSLKQIFLDKKNKILLYFPLITIAYYLLSIRPTTDFIHLTPLIALTSLSLALAIRTSSKIKLKFVLIILLTALCILGAYSSLFRNYYRWNSPLIEQNVFNKNPKVLLWTDNKENQNINEIYKYFANHSQKEKYLFIYNFAPIYYLVLDKKNPTRYDYLHQGVLSENIQKEIISNLQKIKLKNVLTNIDINSDQTLIAKFIRSNYFAVKKVNEYTIWEIR